MKKILIFSFSLLLFQSAFSQFSISGKIYDKDSLGITNASVYLNNGRGAISDKNGYFIIKNISEGNYELFCRIIGYKSFQKTINISGDVILNINLEQDVFSLSEVKVTGTLSNLSGMQSSHGITTILPDLMPYSVNPVAGQSLSNVPGLFVDYTSGDGGNTVYSRGLNPNTGNSFSYVGYRYIALLEDGMPVMSAQIGMLWTDMFLRQSFSVSKIEINRSGASALSVSNTPGGAINYISKQGTEKINIVAEAQIGYYPNGNLFYKTDINTSGSISKSPVRYNINGIYRYDQGPKNLSFMDVHGGQLKANFSIPYKKGQTTLFLKALDDHSIYYQRTPFSDIENNKSYPGFNPLYTSLYVDIEGNVPDSRRLKDDPDAVREEDGSDGIHLQNCYAMIQSKYNVFDSLFINVSAKYSIIKQRYLESFTNIVIPADIGPALIYNLPVQGSTVNFNSFTYTDVKTGEVLASYLNGNEQFNTMGADIHIGSLLDFQSEVNDKIAKVEFEYNKRKHHLILGGDFSHALVENVWNADLTAETFEPQPRLLMITHPNPLFWLAPDQKETMYFTDENGFFGYNYGTYNYFKGSSSVQSGYINDHYKISNKVHAECGIRIENIIHKGIKERWETPTGNDPVIQQFPSGLDGDYTTWYDAGFREATGVYDTIDFNYFTISGSLGLLFLLLEDQSVFLRFTYNNKAPELDYYVNNFDNIKPQKGHTETIKQFELGYKLKKNYFSCQAVTFLNHVENVPFQQFIYINNTTLMTPVTFNTMQTTGIELEFNMSYFKRIQFQLSTTLLNPKLYSFTYYNLNLTPQNSDDDFEEDFSGNYISEIPRINSYLNIYYKVKNIKPYVSFNYVGKRMGNMRNTVELPAYWTVGGGVSFKTFKYFEISLFATNIFNTAGIVSLGGLGSLNNGGTEMLTEQTLDNQIQNGQPIFARTIYPRMIGINIKFLK